jgi:hypothetical protein
MAALLSPSDTVTIDVTFSNAPTPFLLAFFTMATRFPAAGIMV